MNGSGAPDAAQADGAFHDDGAAVALLPDARRPSGAALSAWGKAAAAAALASSFTTLRDMVGPGAYIDPSALRRVKRLGEGGFAVVELCDLLTAPLPPPPSPPDATGADSADSAGEQQQQERQAPQEPRDRSPPVLYRRVAVKRLKPHLVSTPRELETFAGEVALLRRLRHPNVVALVGAGALEDASSAYFVQEYVSGGSLRTLITRHVMTARAGGSGRSTAGGAKTGGGGNGGGGRLRRSGRGLYRIGDAVDIMLQVARALAYLHSRSPMVIHRDVKPDNVLLRGPWPTAPERGRKREAAAAAALAASAAAATRDGGGDGDGDGGDGDGGGIGFHAKLTDFGLAATVTARKAKALRALASRASLRGSTASLPELATAAAAAAAGRGTTAAAAGEAGRPEWAVEGHHPLSLTLGSRAGSVLSSAAPPAPAPAPPQQQHLDALFDRRLSSRALLSPALLHELGRERGDRAGGRGRGGGGRGGRAGAAAAAAPPVPRARSSPAGGGRPASGPSAASSAGRATERGDVDQVYDLTSMTGESLVAFLYVWFLLVSFRQRGARRASIVRPAAPCFRLLAPFPLPANSPSLRHLQLRPHTDQNRKGSLLYMAPEVFVSASSSASSAPALPEEADEGGTGDDAAAAAGLAPAPSLPPSGAAYNEKADVFSFGVMLREVLSAYLLSFAFRDQEELEAYVARVSTGYRPPLDARWPEDLRSLIADCWHQDAGRRPGMGEVVDRLARVAGRGGLPRVAADGGGWDSALGEAGGEGAGGAEDGGGGGGLSRCCVVT